MKELKIVNYPDPVLLSVGKPIHDGDFGTNFEKTVETMFSVMEQGGGVGLAAPQVGISKRFFVMDIRERHVLINPEILSVEGEQIGEEGCLSFPGLYQTIKRDMRVIVKAQNQHGGEIELDLDGLAARCVLHETDHCDGIVFLDRMTPLKRELAKRKIKRLQNTGKWD
jgi:peptide deformylase